jgi:hypothetical protein
MVGLHSLQSVAEHSLAIDLDLAFPGDDRPLGLAPGPEVVVHAAPRLLGVRAVVARSSLSSLETRCCPGECDIDQTAVVDCCLDCVRGAVLVQLDGHAISVEGEVAFVEAVIRERIARPQEGLLVAGIEDLGVELHRRTRTEDVVVDDLKHANVARVRVEVEGLCLDIGVVEGLPLQVVLGQLGVGRVACILANRLDGFRTVDRFLGTGNRGQPVWLSGPGYLFHAVHARHIPTSCIHVRAVEKGSHTLTWPRRTFYGMSEALSKNTLKVTGSETALTGKGRKTLE